MRTTTAFKADIIRGAFEDSFGDRIAMICAAGSMVHGRATPTSDLDLMLVLDSFHAEDIVLCRQVVRRLAPYYYAVGISLQYVDELPLKAEDVQDGSKSSLALAYINSAYLLAGTNVFARLFEELPAVELRRSIIRALEQYLHEMYALAFISSDDDISFQRIALKYFTRSIIDAMLYYHPTDMSPYDKLSHEAVLELYTNSPEIAHITSGMTVDSTPIEMIQGIRLIAVHLKRDYGII